MRLSCALNHLLTYLLIGKKRDSERISLHTLHTGLQCYKPYESRNVKNKAATDGVEPSTHRGVRRSLFAQDDDEVFVTGSQGFHTSPKYFREAQ